MCRRISLLTLSALAIVTLPFSLFSQGAPPLAQPEMSPGPSVNDLISELEQLDRRLDPIEQRALQDPSLIEQQQEIANEILATMIRSDSLLVPKLMRLQEIVEEIHEINGDPVRMKQLTAEVIDLKPYIDAAQAQAMEAPEIVILVDAFHAQVHNRMEEIDPDAHSLIVRHQALEQMLRAALEVDQPVSPPPTPWLPLWARGVKG